MSAMCTWRDSLDGRPGDLPDTRILSDATVLVIFPVNWGVSPDEHARLVLHFDQKGNISAALQRTVVSDAADGMP